MWNLSFFYSKCRSHKKSPYLNLSHNLVKFKNCQMFCLHDYILYNVTMCVCKQSFLVVLIVRNVHTDLGMVSSETFFTFSFVSTSPTIFYVCRGLDTSAPNLRLQAQNRYEKVPKMILSSFQWSWSPAAGAGRRSND